MKPGEAPSSRIDRARRAGKVKQSVYKVVLTIALAATLLLPVSSTRAGDATPVADQPLLAGIAGAEDAAIRAFEATLARREGVIGLTFEVVRFADDEGAAAALPEVVRRLVARFEEDRNGGDPYRPVSIDTLGDETIAYAGSMGFDEPIGDLTAAPFSLVFVRAGEFLHFGIGYTFRGDPLPDVLAILAETVDRPFQAGATPVAASGVRTGGLWDLLPGLADVPEGFVVAEELIPEPFPPLPDQEA